MDIVYYIKVVGVLADWSDKHKEKLNLYDCSSIVANIFPVSEEQALSELIKHQKFKGRLK